MLNTINRQILKLRERLSEFSIDPNDLVFQQGKYLYDAQVLYLKSDNMEKVTEEDVKLICKRYCQLINAVGLLKEDWLAAIELLKE